MEGGGLQTTGCWGEHLRNVHADVLKVQGMNYFGFIEVRESKR